MSDGFTAYKTYMGMKLHFSQRSYSYVKYHGRTNCSIRSFNNRGPNTQWYFKKIERSWSKKELPMFFACNFVQGNIKWPGDIVSDQCQQQFWDWQKYYQAWQHYFGEEVKQLIDLTEFDTIFKTNKHRAPVLLNLLLAGEVSIDCVALLDKAIRFSSPWWKTKMFLIQDTMMPIIKYGQLLAPTKEQVRTVIITHTNNKSEHNG